eukprot:835489-Pyramimonas_sp.AAC.1
MTRPTMLGSRSWCSASCGSFGSGGDAVAPPPRLGRGRGRSVAGRKPGRGARFQPIIDTFDKRKETPQC